MSNEFIRLGKNELKKGVKNFVDNSWEKLTAASKLNTNFINIGDFYNFIKSDGGRNTPTPSWYFCVGFYSYENFINGYLNVSQGSMLNDNFFNKYSNEFAKFRYCIQSVDLPDLSIRGSTSSSGTSDGVSDISNIFGGYTLMNNSNVNADNHRLTMNIMNTQLPVIENFIYPWMLAAVNTNELNESYPIPKVNMSIKFWAPNNMDSNMEVIKPDYMYYITGLYPIKLISNKPKQMVDQNNINRQVTFAFNDFIIINSYSDILKNNLYEFGESFLKDWIRKKLKFNSFDPPIPKRFSKWLKPEYNTHNNRSRTNYNKKLNNEDNGDNGDNNYKIHNHKQNFNKDKLQNNDFNVNYKIKNNILDNKKIDNKDFNINKFIDKNEKNKKNNKNKKSLNEILKLSSNNNDFFRKKYNDNKLSNLVDNIVVDNKNVKSSNDEKTKDNDLLKNNISLNKIKNKINDDKLNIEDLKKSTYENSKTKNENNEIKIDNIVVDNKNNVKQNKDLNDLNDNFIKLNTNKIDKETNDDKLNNYISETSLHKTKLKNKSIDDLNINFKESKEPKDHKDFNIVNYNSKIKLSNKEQKNKSIDNLNVENENNKIKNEDKNENKKHNEYKSVFTYLKHTFKNKSIDVLINENIEDIKDTGKNESILNDELIINDNKKINKSNMSGMINLEDISEISGMNKNYINLYKIKNNEELSEDDTLSKNYDAFLMASKIISENNVDDELIIKNENEDENENENENINNNDKSNSEKSSFNNILSSFNLNESKFRKDVILNEDDFNEINDYDNELNAVKQKLNSYDLNLHDELKHNFEYKLEPKNFENNFSKIDNEFTLNDSKKRKDEIFKDDDFEEILETNDELENAKENNKTLNNDVQNKKENKRNFNDIFKNFIDDNKHETFSNINNNFTLEESKKRKDEIFKDDDFEEIIETKNELKTAIKTNENNFLSQHDIDDLF